MFDDRFPEENGQIRSPALPPRGGLSFFICFRQMKKQKNPINPVNPVRILL
jgi:hypothetical protein